MTTDDERDAFWRKARENLASAQSEYVNARYNACANRLYYAAFHAAIVALLDAGLPARTGTWGHGYVQAQFAGQLITRRKLFAAEFRDTLTVLQELRTKADYDHTPVSQREAGRALRRAQALLTAIATRGGE
jgi:uncharacterized protein (UPF0332 family)